MKFFLPAIAFSFLAFPPSGLAKAPHLRRGKNKNGHRRGLQQAATKAFQTKQELVDAITTGYNEPTVLDIYGPIQSWNVSLITDFSGLFRGNQQFNEDIGDWDVSSATDMHDMFHSCVVTDMYYFMGGALEFNQPIGDWDVSNVNRFHKAFKNMPKFNQDLSNWNVTSATDMFEMFKDDGSFNQNLCAWRDHMIASPTPEVSGMFTNTACPDTADPSLDTFQEGGPFCHGTCIEVPPLPECIEGVMTGQQTTDACNGNCCVGNEACKWSTAIPVSICTDSCVGDEACATIKSLDPMSDQIFIGMGSCKGTRACYNYQSIEVGGNTCNDESACSDVYRGVAGDNSCNGKSACDGLSGSVGDNSCNNGRHACNIPRGTIGDNSCNNGDEACWDHESVTIDPNSCNDGYRACYRMMEPQASLLVLEGNTESESLLSIVKSLSEPPCNDC